MLTVLYVWNPFLFVCKFVHLPSKQYDQDLKKKRKLNLIRQTTQSIYIKLKYNNTCSKHECYFRLKLHLADMQFNWTRSGLIRANNIISCQQQYSLSILINFVLLIKDFIGTFYCDNTTCIFILHFSESKYISIWKCSSIIPSKCFHVSI